MYENSFYGAVPIETGTAFGQGRYGYDDFFRLPEEVQEQVNQRAIERQFHSEEELRHYVQKLLLKS